MLSKKKLNFESKMRVSDNILIPDKNPHSLGLSYICSFLDHVGFTILKVNTDPNHHFQLLAKINDKSLLIAVRSAYAPEVGTIDTPTLENLVRESEELNAIPHFAGLTVNFGQEYKVVFNGISAVTQSEIKAA